MGAKKCVERPLGCCGEGIKQAPTCICLIPLTILLGVGYTRQFFNFSLEMPDPDFCLVGFDPIKTKTQFVLKTK